MRRFSLPAATTAVAVLISGGGLAAGGSPAYAEPPSQAPIVQQIPDRLDQVGEPVRLQVDAVDPQGDPVTFSEESLPPGLSIDASGLITGAPTTVGQNVVFIDAVDPSGNRGWEAFRWDVVEPLVITDPGDQVTALGSRVSLALAVSAAAWEEPVITATGLPDGLLLQGARIHGAPTSRGTSPVVLTVATKHGRTASTSLRWTTGAEPSAPLRITAAGGPDSAVVSWQPPDFAGSGITGYTITRLPTEHVVTVGPEQRSLAVTGLTSGATYTFEVRAVNASGAGPAGRASVVGTTVLFVEPAAVVNQGAAVTLRGKLWSHDHRFVAGSVLRLEQLRSDSAKWTTVGAVTTGADGSWSRSVKPPVNTQYRVAFAGGVSRMGSVSVTRTVTVRYAVTAKPSNRKPQAKKKIKITGTVTPARTSTVVVLERLVGEEWVKLTTTETTLKGAYSISRAFTKGTWKLRVRVPATQYNAEQTSARMTVKAR
ncbi:MAG TPA: fibronectin type III domain-containing protein [Actinoplanes sp.]|nr:fibronectin type III domain-containing protein [Actinoplanes sp.]